jgi:TonB-dependent SusC/RagA subfamily outer membrane receptor
VQVYFNGGLTGASPQINIRGQNSLSLSNQPLLYIDGVRVDNSPAGPPTAPVAAGASSGRFNDLLPSEIESIEIVKGPSAATLYGTDAANGVILVRTKRGTAGAPRWTISGEAGLLTFDRNRFATNYYPWGHSTTSGSGSAVRCPLEVVATGACVQDSVTSFSPLLNAETTPIGNGSRSSASLQVSGGGSSLLYFLSGTTEQETGYLKMPDTDRHLLEVQMGGRPLSDEALRPNTVQRNGGRANLTVPLTPATDVAISVGLNAEQFRIPNPLVLDNAAGPGIRDQNDGWRAGGRPGDSFIKRNRESVTHVTTSLTGNWHPTSWLTGRLMTGLDYSSDYFDLLAPAGVGFLPATITGSRENTKALISLQTVDGNLSLKAPIRSWLTSNTSVGAQYNRRTALTTTAAATQLTPGSETVAGGAVATAKESTTETVVAGSYVEQTFGFNERLFATAAVRADGGSAFGTGFRTAIYPKASLSWLVSDEPFWPTIRGLTSVRIRAAAGESGVQPGPVAALASETLFPVVINGTAATGAGLGAVGNQDLKPERQREFEAGIDVQAFQNTISLALTRYDKRSTDALVSMPLPASFGGGTRWENVGAVRNWGYEATLRVAAIQRPRLNWTVSLNGSLNDNTVLSIAPSVDAVYSTGFPAIARGYPLFSYFEFPITAYRDANQNGIIEGSEVTVGETRAFAGRSYPRTQLSGTSEIGLLGDRMRLSATVEHRGGFSLLNPEFIRCTLDACAAVSFPNAPFADQAAAAARRTAALGNTFWGYIEDASFTRLRELSLTYSLPSRISQQLRARDVALTLAGRNLALWSHYHGTDPEVQGFVGATNRGAGYDRSGPPAATYWLLRVRISP